MIYLKHYFTFPDILWFILVSAGVLALMQLIMLAVSRAKQADKDSASGLLTRGESFDCLNEMYAELLFSSTAILLFVGIFFLISYDYFPLPDSFYAVWNRYGAFFLLGLLVVAILLIDLLDCFVVPVRLLSDEMRSTLRIAAMIYMIAVFIYIKFIYEDDNYDTMIIYCLVMLIGRFIYFDVSIRDVLRMWKNLFFVLPTLLMVLGTTALLALYGFFSGYLLKGNGVVLSLWIAHMFVIIEFWILMKARGYIKRRRTISEGQKKRAHEVPAAGDKELSKTDID